jgi:hypothetical protein
VSERAKNGARMQWLRMIPSEEARKTHRGVLTYFDSVGQPIELTGSSEDDDEEGDESEDEDEDEDERMGDDGVDIGEELANHG